MKIEIGKTYSLSAYNKKSLFEIEMFKNPDNGKMLNTEVMWRNGTFIVRVEDLDEQIELEACIGEDGDEFDYDSFSNIEMWDCFDGCSEDFVHYGNHFTEEEQEQLAEDYEEQLEGDDWMSRYEWLEERGFESLGCNYVIHGGIEVELNDEEMEPLE